MPPRKQRTLRKKDSEEDDLKTSQMVVQHNPDIVQAALKDYYLLVEAKCVQLKRDADFMVTSLQHEFQCEMFKLPKQVKEMTLKQFKEEFGGSIEAVTKNAFAVPKTGENKNFNIETRPHSPKAFQTPANPKKTQAPGTLARMPREGEQLLSANGSPLGAFSTVKKPLRDNNGIIPPTPGVFVPLKTGEVIDLESTDVETLPMEAKLEALNQMEAMMANMKMMMEKLKSSSVV